jgi:hypothetical protein
MTQANYKSGEGTNSQPVATLDTWLKRRAGLDRRQNQKPELHNPLHRLKALEAWTVRLIKADWQIPVKYGT